jgi:hypothetical protein
MKTKQLYFRGTKRLLTRLSSSEGVGEVIEEVRYELHCQLWFEYAKKGHSVVPIDDRDVVFRAKGADGADLLLRGTVPIAALAGDAGAEFTLTAGGRPHFLPESKGDCGELIDSVYLYHKCGNINLEQL